MIKIERKSYYDIGEIAAELMLSETQIRNLTKQLLVADIHYFYLRGTILYERGVIAILKKRNRKGGRPKKNGD